MGGGGGDEGVLTLLQRRENTIGHMRGELGVWSSEASYPTLHGGMATLGDDHTSLHQDVLSLAEKLKTVEERADDSRAEVHHVRMATASLGSDMARLALARGAGGEVDALRQEVQGLKAERADMETTVLALTAAVTSLMRRQLTGHLTAPIRAISRPGLRNTTRPLMDAWTHSAKR